MKHWPRERQKKQQGGSKRKRLEKELKRPLGRRERRKLRLEGRGKRLKRGGRKKKSRKEDSVKRRLEEEQKRPQERKVRKQLLQRKKLRKLPGDKRKKKNAKKEKLLPPR